ncbi:hypothetical protein ACFPN7_07440 [Amycolatopsis halotolerans]|uniref:hypothetical protein n=1 Tax=Amycolatopsis halotolerans TaxID=330083 RepID=UPI0036122C22
MPFGAAASRVNPIVAAAPLAKHARHRRVRSKAQPRRGKACPRKCGKPTHG